MSADSEKYNADELIAPSWLDKAFFTKVLQQNVDDSAIIIHDLRITPGTGKNDHYASIMFRASVDYQHGVERKNKLMIIKTMPEAEGNKKDLFENSFLFETEIGIYKDVLPMFEKILRSVGDDTVLNPPCLYHSLTPKKVIIFEDIVPLGYTVIRDRALTLEEVKATYLKLAKWHALSYKINKENPQCFDEYRHTFFVKPDIKEAEFMTDGITNFIEMLDNTPSLKKYKPYFEAMKDNILDKCIESFLEYRNNPQEDAYYVLLHGDFHAKNLMFKHDKKTGAFEDVMLLDYQIACVGPIVMDLIYSTYLILSPEMRADNLEELQYYYFSNFVETLRKIGYKGEMPKIMELRKQLMRHKHFDMFLFVSFLPLWIGMQDDLDDMEELLSSNDSRKSAFYNKRYLKVVEKTLPKYLHMGYLDN